jgi:hypothetical protein
MEIQTGNEEGIGSRKTLSSTTKQTCLWKGFEKSTKKDRTGYSILNQQYAASIK